MLLLLSIFLGFCLNCQVNDIHFLQRRRMMAIFLDEPSYPLSFIRAQYRMAADFGETPIMTYFCYPMLIALDPFYEITFAQGFSLCSNSLWEPLPACYRIIRLVVMY
ncbi:hypothetical protein MHBO_001969 [Bonamia ostreae]|uniref:Secreted protein n=1 Tax=Bonamia ostreae TaxID=126728 RepID=A0ABV2AKS9_9EUKA